MRKFIPASTIAAALLCGSQAMADPRDAVNSGGASESSWLQRAVDKGVTTIIKKGATFIAGRVVGFGVGQMLDSNTLNAGEDAAVRRMNEQWRQQQENRGVPIPSRKP